MIIMIEIDLQKLERGVKTEWRTVHRGGKAFRQRFKVGMRDVETATGAATSMTKDKLTDMVPAYDRAPGDEIYDTLHQGDLYRCEFEDGTQAIHKVMDDTAVAGETLYYKVNKILGFNTCPETVSANFGEGFGSCQEWVPDNVGAYELDVNRQDMNALAEVFAQDILLCSGDRHDENILKDTDGYWHAIDNEDWGNYQPVNDWMKSVDGVIETGGLVTYCPQMSWMYHQYGGYPDDIQDDFIAFKERVIDHLKAALEHEDEIKALYNDQLKIDNEFIQHRANNVLAGLHEIRKYIEEES